MAQLPIFQSDSQPLNLMQTRWAAVLNALLSNPLLNGRLIKGISLTTGANSINHTLGRTPQGYIIVGMREAYEEIYDAGSTMPQLTLVLNSSGDCEIDLYVF